ncbi:MAG: TlpA family protein disulfide reductase [Bacteroidia bacterium]|nr:TlpA family protein disulfide reductase [Bacteroidia bacterium]NND26928.1 TlpA family protein disulfide reductase [Flavobacteriaceae bacterium]NNL32287.1 TlpA family protein disulfide reductase [Flavobacteriaceae bacterium]
MKLNRSRRSNIIFFGLILILIIPQTRQPIQVLLHKGLALFGTSIIDENKREQLKFENWNLMGLNGDQINFKSLEGEVIFLNFWATWCPPCIAEMESIQSLYDDYNTKVRFVLISNEPSEVVTAFFEKEGYDMEVYSPLSEYPEDLNVRSIPRTYIIDKQGKVVIDKSGAANWNSNAIREQLELLLAQ